MHRRARDLLERSQMVPVADGSFGLSESPAGGVEVPRCWGACLSRGAQSARQLALGQRFTLVPH
jgi:hypothetical protein